MFNLYLLINEYVCVWKFACAMRVWARASHKNRTYKKHMYEIDVEQ